MVSPYKTKLYRIRSFNFGFCLNKPIIGIILWSRWKAQEEHRTTQTKTILNNMKRNFNWIYSKDFQDHREEKKVCS